MHSTCSLRITLQVVVDDLLEAPWDNQGFTIMPTCIPNNRILRKMLRERISENEFSFDQLLLGVPLRGRKTPTYVPVVMKDHRLIEEKGFGGRDLWFVETDWSFIDPRDTKSTTTKRKSKNDTTVVVIDSRSQVDDPQLLSDLFGQLSDGWGEGVSQFRFGSRVKCDGPDDVCVLDRPVREYEESDGDYSVMGRFAFNLTAIGARIL